MSTKRSKISTTRISKSDKLSHFVRGVDKLHLYDGNWSYSHYEEIPCNGYKVVIATPNRLPIGLLFQYEQLNFEGFPDPMNKPGGAVEGCLYQKIALIVLAVKGSSVIATSAIQLTPIKSSGMGMEGPTRESVVELVTMYTKPAYRKRGIASKLVEVRLTRGVDALLECMQEIVLHQKGHLLKRKHDATDMAFEPNRLLESLQGPDSIMRVIFENMDDHLKRTIRIAAACGYIKSAAAVSLMERKLGNIEILRENADKVSLTVGRTSVENGMSITRQDQVIFLGPDAYSRAKAIADFVVAASNASLKYDVEGEEFWSNHNPELTVLPEISGAIDLRHLSLQEAKEKADQIKLGTVIVSTIPAAIIGWGLHRNKSSVTE
jgi:GNAT superfamily N-acetyltransferase